MYKRLNTLQCRIDVEESINKLRWNRIIKKSREERDDAIEEAEFVDVEARKVDIHALQPRNLPFNPSVAMPRALSLEEEVKIFQVKSEIARITEDVARRSVEFSNLTEKEKRGLKSLQQRCEVGEIICTVTDKSGRWSCDTTENYKDGCTKLVEDQNKTPTVTSDEHREAEKEMNSHALALGRMLGLKDGESGKRLRNSITAEGTSIAPLYGLRKDHKPEAEDEMERIKGPKMRPICGARDSLTKRTSYLLCKILKPLLEGEATDCDSTDDLIYQFEKINRGEVNDKWVIGSLDVESLYPSLNIPKCVEVIKKKLISCTMDFENLEWKEIMLYLRYNLKEEEVVRNGYQDFLPRRKYHRRPPLFIRSGSNNNMKIRYQPWIFPPKPEEWMIREMFCEAIATMIRRTMELHDFQIDGEMYRQREGGSIGMDLTGLVSDIYMCEWDKEVISGMNTEQIKSQLYKRYKDDVNMILEINDESEVVADIGKLTMERVKKIADSVDDNLKVTTDCTENHVDGKLPILDLKVWIGKNEEGVCKILYTHYMKEVASRAVIHFRSSHSPEMKKNVMVNEVIRIIRNCSDELPWEEKVEHITYLAKRMQFSEYPEEVRCKVMMEAIKKYDKLKRTKRLRVDDRERDVIGNVASHWNKKQQWYTRDGRFESVMFVEATPNSELAKRIREVMKKEGLHIMIVEKAGITIKGLLQRSNPFGTSHCEREECSICEHGSSVDCRLRGCVYEYLCEQCNRKYRGQTGRSIYERNKEHMEAWNRGDDEEPLQRHSNIYHEGERFDVKLNVLAKCYGRPSKRMITEAVMIEELPDDETMNNKKEWTYTKLGKMHLIGQ